MDSVNSPDRLIKSLVCPLVCCKLQHFYDETDIRVITYKNLLIVWYLSKVAVDAKKRYSVSVRRMAKPANVRQQSARHTPCIDESFG